MVKTLKSFFWICLTLTAINASGQQNADILHYVETYRDIAMSEMKRTGVPAAITLAQGIHESMAGKSDLVRRSNNHFGIKCKNTWTGERVYHTDDAVGECFRKYPKAEDSYLDHSDFLKTNSRYAFLFQLQPDDYKGWAYGLKKAGYATNPRYPEYIIKYVEIYNLQDYTLMVMRGNDGDVAPPVAESQVPPADVPVPEKAEPPVRPAVNMSVILPANLSAPFKINETSVVFAKKGTALLALAEEHGVSLRRLLDFNELESDAPLQEDQLIFLQRKRKTGSGPFHLVKEGETLYSICQSEGIRLESLCAYNKISRDMQPAIGEKLYLQSPAPVAPRLLGNRGFRQ